MHTLHIDLRQIDDQRVHLNFYKSNPNDRNTQQRQLSDIPDLIKTANRDYYVRLAEDYAVTGQRLFQWLDGSERWLTEAIDSCIDEVLVLAISTSGHLSHLPWEVLHDGNRFLVEHVNPCVVPVRKAAGKARPIAVDNRALRLLFMATSPEDEANVLDFEREESRILEATQRQPIELLVEESGCLSDLKDLVRDFRAGYLDVFHLTGHGTLHQGNPVFLTETDTGRSELASPRDIGAAFRFRFPKLMFLSGCRTGEAGRTDDGIIPSLAEQLVGQGAPAVLSWGRPVLDHEATEATAALYEALSEGLTLPEAIAAVYQSLRQNNARDWHLLRLYVADDVPGALVTPRKTPGRERPLALPKISDETTRALDDAGMVRVCNPAGFVGRRRPLQHCLRALRDTSDTIGVLIYGMGGYGKSTLAMRLADRLSSYRRVTHVGGIDETDLVNLLADQVNEPEVQRQLRATEPGLKYRLRQFFDWYGEQPSYQDKPFLLVLDDFEYQPQPSDVHQVANLELRPNSTPVLTPNARAVLEALAFALSQSPISHRVIITSRYDIESPHLSNFYKQPLAPFRAADLKKKCQRLQAFGPDSLVESEVQARAVKLADGNPRLLEWLNQVMLHPDTFTAETPQPAGHPTSSGQERILTILAQLDENPSELREQVLAQALVNQIDAPLKTLLQRGLVYHLPVPRAAIADLCDDISALDSQIERAIALGLLAVSPNQALYVPRILPLEPPNEADEALYGQAAQVLYRLWWEEAETSTEEQRLEIHRLAVAGKEGAIAATIASTLASQWKNQSRFREAAYLCKLTLAITDDYRVLHQLARSKEPLGEVDEARAHYEQARDTCPDGDEKEKSAIIHNLAIIYANQGQVEQAIELYQQSLELQERIGDVQGKAATLHQLAGIYANQGQVEQAIELYQQSLELQERIGNVQGKAATLANMAYLAGHQEDRERQRQFNSQAAEALGQIGAYIDLVTVLGNIGVTADNKVTYFAQALWLALRVQVSFSSLMSQINNLFQVVPQGDELEPLLATTALFTCAQHSDHPEIQTHQQTALDMIGYVAKAKGIETQEALQAWMSQEQLTEPDVFLSRLMQRLEAIVDEEAWLFDQREV